MRALVVGASKGIGLGLATRLLANGWTVDATVRNDAGKQNLLAAATAHAAALTIHFVDVSRPEDAQRLAEDFEAVELDLLFLNAGVYGPSNQATLDVSPAEFDHVMRVNALGPMQIAHRLRNNIAEGSGVIAFTSSIRGSVASVKDSSGPIYKASKAALNAMARSLFPALKDRGVSLLLFHPGWVRTDMGGDNAPVSIEDSVTGMLACVDAYRGKAAEAFLDYQGAILPW